MFYGAGEIYLVIVALLLRAGRRAREISTVRVHEFEASAETLKDLKVGDHIEARRRAAND
jgi:hypothetical protein